MSTIIYNIDFRVSGQIVSIPVAHNDTLSTLSAQMKSMQHFVKYTQLELEQKLAASLINMIKKDTIQSKIKSRIAFLVDSFDQKTYTNPKSNKIIQNQTHNSLIHDISNINIPNQNSIKVSSACKEEKRPQRGMNYNKSYQDRLKQNRQKSELYYSKGQNSLFCHLNKLGTSSPRKYNHSQLQGQINEPCENSFFYTRKKSLSFGQLQDKYILKQQQKSFSFLKNQNQNCSRKKYHYIKNSLHQPQLIKDYIQEKHFIRNSANFHNKSQSSPYNQVKKRQEVNTVVHLNQKELNYNPVPKLDQLIARTRSLTRVAHNKYLYDENNLIDCHGINNHNRQNNTGQSNAGKIKHRQITKNFPFHDQQSSLIINQSLIQKRSLERADQSNHLAGRQHRKQYKEINLLQRKTHVNLQKQKTFLMKQNQKNNQNKKVYCYL